MYMDAAPVLMGRSDGDVPVANRPETIYGSSITVQVRGAAYLCQVLSFSHVYTLACRRTRRCAETSCSLPDVAWSRIGRSVRRVGMYSNDTGDHVRLSA